MPKFLYTVVLLSVLAWLGIVRYVFKVPPETFTNIFGFLILLFVAIALTISIPVYFFLHRRAPTFSNLRYLYRKSFKWGAFLSFGITFILGLRAFSLDNGINVFLFVLLYVLLFTQIRTKR